MEELKLAPIEEVEFVDCSEILSDEIEEMIELGTKMIEFCTKKGGVGLAAPQIGINKKMFVWMNSPDTFEIVFNPKYFKDGKKTNVLEGCLTYGTGNTFLVERFKNISVIYDSVDINRKLKSKNKKLSFERAFIFQHETDHLNGKTIKLIGTSI